MITSYEYFFQQLTPSTTVLTPNRRLSASLVKLYQAQQILLQKLCWETPDILPVGAWLERSFNHFIANEFDPAPLLLNAMQEQFLWEKILTSSKESEYLLQVSKTASIVKSSNTLLKQWCIDIHHPIFNTTEDYLALQSWVKQFQSLCEKENWLDHANLPDFLIEKIKDKKIQLPAHLILVGFTDISPQLERLLSAYKMQACKVSYYEFPEVETSCQRICLPDEENEVLSMARWAKTILQHNNKATIGCVIPNLDKKRDRVMQIFSEVFAPENCYGFYATTGEFNISAGKSLLQYPIIHAALQFLGLNKKNISMEVLSYILRTPFLGEAEKERLKRANLDCQLRQKNINSIPINFLINSEDKINLLFFQHCPLLAKRLANFYEVLEKNNRTLLFSEWAVLFNELLTCLAWPGERSLNSDEYQIVENWLSLLTHFKLLDQISTPVNYHQALQTLFNMTNETIFQPKTPDAPVQVLGILEAAGLSFDYLWVAGMHDMAWPPQPQPNPFIPKSLQRELTMPHATAERELIYCQQLTQQFKQSAKETFFSYAEKDEELQLQASPLIQDLPEINLDALLLNPFIKPSERIFLSKNLEILLDEKGPSISVQEKIYGGVNVIKQQALCPFKAFAEWRLHAHELETTQPGLRSKERGTIIHKILETIWTTLQTQAELAALDEQALRRLIENSIDTALELVQHRHKKESRYIQLEKERLFKIIDDWLAMEKSRPPFRVITNEKAAQIKLSQLDLSIRVDRIDALEDGTKLIIDYKTGKNNDINTWFSIRPEEPQLPIYAMIDPKNTSGISFAQITPGEHCFKGVSHFSLEIKGIKLLTEVKKTQALSWVEQLDQWSTILTKLSDDFYQGIATVDPKESVKTCAWCALKPLCRIHEEVMPE